MYHERTSVFGGMSERIANTKSPFGAIIVKISIKYIWACVLDHCRLYDRIRSWAIDIHFIVREWTDFPAIGSFTDIGLPLHMVVWILWDTKKHRSNKVPSSFMRLDSATHKVYQLIPISQASERISGGRQRRNGNQLPMTLGQLTNSSERVSALELYPWRWWVLRVLNPKIRYLLGHELLICIWW